VDEGSIYTRLSTPAAGSETTGDESQTFSSTARQRVTGARNLAFIARRKALDELLIARSAGSLINR
jgi:hypothetical protein